MVEDNRLPEPPPPPSPPQTVDGQAPHPENPGVLYEHTDASFRSIARIILISAVVGVVVLYAILRSSIALTRTTRRGSKPRPTRWQPSRSSQLPRGAAPGADQPHGERPERRMSTCARRRRRILKLRSYTSAEDGYVHIPIDRAMDYLAGKLAVRKEQPSGKQAERQNGLVDAGASNSGRMFRGDKP